MADSRSHLIDWLNDAHAMEKQAETMLKSLSGRIENYPELRRRIEQHITETQSQAQRLESCMERLGASGSAMKDAAGRMTAMMQGASGMFVGDEVVKGAMASYAFEHFEISSYNCLIAAAELVGDQETARVCREILEEEKAMAGWLEANLPAVTQEYLRREDMGGPAKH